MRNLSLGLAVVVLGACGPHVGASGGDVGAPCTANSQCSTECLQGSDHFPGGMCTIPCTSDVQCPKGAVCIDDHDQKICAVACALPGDCNAFGRGFACDAVDHVGVGGQTLVCRVP